MEVSARHIPKVYALSSRIQVTENSRAILKIPSQMYPLQGEPNLIANGNTDDFEAGEEREQVEAIFNSIPAKIGACYTNTEDLVEKLRAAGFNAQSMVGWLFIDGLLPVHHCFATLGGHILDLTILPELLMGNPSEAKAAADQRQAIAERIRRASTRPNTEKCTFGKVSAHSIYIAAIGKPAVGRKERERLIRAYPKHPCFADGRTMNATQKRILKALGQ